MSFELESRGYQRDAVGELRVAVREYSSAVYVLPTGGGKTHVAAMVARLASKRDASVMFLVHRRELVRQAISTLRRAVPGMSIGVEAAGWPSMPWARLQVGSFPTVIKRPWLAEQMVIKLLIVDEAHHCRAASWEQVIGFWPEAKRIGLTATPERLDGKGLLPHFATMVIGPSIPELVVAGHLAPCRVVRISLDDKLKNFKRNRTGEIMGKDQAELLSSAPVIAAGASSYLRYAKGRRALFFGINRIHSERVCEQLRSAGVRAAHLDGLDTNARRDRVLRQFATGGLDLLGNCDLFSEGLDVPECDCVILGAPTRSVTRYLQAAGRGMRPGPGKVLLVIDAAGISHDLGPAGRGARMVTRRGRSRKRTREIQAEAPNMRPMRDRFLWTQVYELRLCFGPTTRRGGA